MKFIFFLCLTSLATSATLKSEGLRCNLREGDRVVMSGTFIGTKPRSVLTLAIRNPLRNTIAARVEIYPNVRTVLLRATTTGRRRPDLVREAEYEGGNEVQIELTVNNGGGYDVRINHRDYGRIPRITGPVPTIVDTAFDINTKQLQVFSPCAVHPATATTASRTTSTTPSTTTLSPAVQAAITALNDAKSKLAKAIKAQNTANAAAVAAVKEFKEAQITAASKKALNEQAIAALQSMSTAAASALAAANIAVAQATIAKTAATTARDAAQAAHAAAAGTAKAEAAASLAKAEAALTKATTDETAVRAAQARISTASGGVTTALTFARNKATADDATNVKATREAQRKATVAAAAALAAKNEVIVKTREVEAAEAALAIAKSG